MDQDLIIIKPPYAVSLSDGPLYKVKCPACGMEGEVSQAKIASFNRNMVEQQMYVNGERKVPPPLPEWSGKPRKPRQQRSDENGSGVMDPRKAETKTTETSSGDATETQG
jgi:hypothetical protein